MSDTRALYPNNWLILCSGLDALAFVLVFLFVSDRALASDMGWFC